MEGIAEDQFDHFNNQAADFSLACNFNRFVDLEMIVWSRLDMKTKGSLDD